MDNSDDAKKWQVLSTEVLHENPWFALRKQQVKLPDETEITYYSEHREKSSVGVVVRRNNGTEYLLNRQHRFLVDRFCWEIPAGNIDAGETPEQAAAREVLEETGYKVGSLEHIYTFNPTIGTSDEMFEVFLADDPEKMTKHFDNNEIVEHRWFSEAEIRQMFADNEICDALTLVPIMHLLLRQEK